MLALSSCAPVWFHDIKNIGDNEYLVSGVSDDNGKLYKCKRVGSKLKCKLIVSESSLSQ